MKNLKNDRQLLMKLANETVIFREEINTDRLEVAFSDISPLEYVVLRSLWPQLEECEECPKNQIYLQQIQEKQIHVPMNRISAMVEKLKNKGLVKWEIGSSGTYIQMSEAGFERFQKQQLTMLKFFDEVVEKMGREKLDEMFEYMKECRSAMREVAFEMKKEA